MTRVSDFGPRIRILIGADDRCYRDRLSGADRLQGQGWHFVVLTDAEKRARLAELSRRGFDLLTQRHAPR